MSDPILLNFHGEREMPDGQLITQQVTLEGNPDDIVEFISRFRYFQRSLVMKAVGQSLEQVGDPDEL